MDSVIQKKAEEILEAFAKIKEGRKLTHNEKTFEKRTISFLKIGGVKVASKVKGSSGVNSQLAKKFAQKGRETQLYRGGLQGAKEKNKEAKENPEELEKQLAKETAAHELEEAKKEAVETQILADSENVSGAGEEEVEENQEGSVEETEETPEEVVEEPKNKKRGRPRKK